MTDNPWYKELPPTVLTMVRDRLIEDGYDGLCHEGCACDLDDLAPCGNMYGHCRAGFKAPCTCGDSCGFHIVPEKPA